MITYSGCYEEDWQALFYIQFVLRNSINIRLYPGQNFYTHTGPWLCQEFSFLIFTAL